MNMQTLKNVLTLAREVRIQMRDSRVIHASVVELPGDDSFFVRPWGVSETIAVRFDDVSSARPVSRMDWQQQRTITAAQVLFYAHDHIPPGDARA